MARLGIHQGLAPVLDVTRDLRWGRVEETLGEDPYLVGTMASAYVRGLQHSGVVATLKHFLGYSASRGRAQPRTGLDGRPRARRRDAAALRDGAARRRALGDERLHRRRRRPLGRRRPPPHHAAARHARLRGHRGRRLLLGGVPAHAAPDGRRPRRGGRPGPRGRHRRRAPDGRRLRRAAARGARRRGGSTRSWSTGRCDGCCARSASSACWTRTGRRSRPARSTSTRPRPGPSRSSWPAARWCCSPTTARCRCPGDAGSRWSVPTPTPARRCSAATRSRCTCCRTTPTTTSGSGDPHPARGARAASYDVVHERGCGDRRAGPAGRRAGRPRGGDGGGRRGGRRRRRVRRGARRPRRAVRQRHVGRGLRRRRPAPARAPGGAARAAARDRHPGRRRAAGRAGPTT